MPIIFALAAALALIILSTGCYQADNGNADGLNARSLHKNTTLPDQIWIRPERIKTLPQSGAAWDRVFSAANEPLPAPDLSNQHSKTNVKILARALVYARNNQDRYRDEVINACMMIPGTQRGGRALALGKQLMAYVIAADLVELPPEKDERFKSWLRHVLAYRFPSGKTLRSTHENRPNNWGTLAGASRLATAVYLGNKEEVQRCAEIFRGWLGDRRVYAGFDYKDRSWQASPSRPVGINPRGATKNGHSIDGVLPDDQRRGGPFQWPPPKENYVYTALQGAVAQAVILERCGYNPWEWEDRALLRAFKWQYDVANYPAEGNDVWMLFVINDAYDANFPAKTPSKPGKNMAWTAWLSQTGD